MSNNSTFSDRFADFSRKLILMYFLNLTAVTQDANCHLVSSAFLNPKFFIIPIIFLFFFQKVLDVSKFVSIFVADSM